MKAVFPLLATTALALPTALWAQSTSGVEFYGHFNPAWQSVDDGAQKIMGGDSDLPGYFIEPTIFQGVTPDMKIAREEIFGPVLGIMPMKTAEDSLAVASDTDYGLHATVFTQDIDRALHMARALPCGTVSVNGFSEGDIKTPFGGYKQSGSLARDNGTEALEQYLQTKTIWIQTNSG